MKPEAIKEPLGRLPHPGENATIRIFRLFLTPPIGVSFFLDGFQIFPDVRYSRRIVAHERDVSPKEGYSGLPGSRV
jgi:hypothetical protein